GRPVGRVGSSGAGEPPIPQLVPRLYGVAAGPVRLGGVDVRDLSFQSIRETLGMVTQDGHLFHESIRENLLLARPEATEEELWDVLDRKSTRLNSSHVKISYAVFCLKKKNYK